MEKRKSKGTKSDPLTVSSYSQENVQTSAKRGIVTVSIFLLFFVSLVLVLGGPPRSHHLQVVETTGASGAVVVSNIRGSEEVKDGPPVELSPALPLVPQSFPADPTNSVEDLTEQGIQLSEKISALREMKRSGTVMEKDEAALSLIADLQSQLRRYLILRYGPEPYRVEMLLQFPESMPDYVSAGPTGRIVITLAPIDLVPYCVYNFLEIVSSWKGGAFHRNAGHVLQAMVKSSLPGLAYQEYHPDYPHKYLTMGYAGRPGGPAFYISTVDNSQNHGPASQGSKTEADGCFGSIQVGSESEKVVKRMTRQPGGKKPSGFVEKESNYIMITSLRLMRKDEL